MLFDIYLIKHLRDLSILVDEKSLAIDPHVLLSVHAFLDPDAILLDNILLGVGHKIELQSVLRAEFLVRLFIVGRNTKELYVLLFEFVVRITERACFLGSARCVVFRIEE